ncbi:Rhodanese-like domain-containing protein [Thalictrum thalictroides]|uniref:Rhodanese-like domain-containing protein n=1 Tax=Thalictrum thalictroides TaxID=46969 RepID=A0A7J6VZ35_THATH|nr:Rhodanese-like domain-containing protein [Thalictrum thalictroides]
MAVHLDQLHTSSFKLKYEKKSKLQYSNSQRTSLCINAVSLSARELVQSGTVRPVLTKDAVSVINNEGFKLLDIRPVWEREKAYVPGSLHVPLFVNDDDNGPITLLKKWVHFGYIGLWTGQKFTTINPDFLQGVDKFVSDKDAKLLVACGEGLRSLMAVTRLYEGGYKNLGWLAGGFNKAEDDHFPVVEVAFTQNAEVYISCGVKQ